MLNFYLNPQAQSFTLEGVLHTSVINCAEAITSGSIILVDVREEEELDIASFDIPDVLHHPMSSIMETYQQIPTDKMVVVACNNGIRSVKVANLLMRLGWDTVVNLDGGLVEWSRKGLPLKVHPHSNTSEGASCGCNSCGDGCIACG